MQLKLAICCLWVQGILRVPEESAPQALDPYHGQSSIQGPKEQSFLGKESRYVRFIRGMQSDLLKSLLHSSFAACSREVLLLLIWFVPNRIALARVLTLVKLKNGLSILTSSSKVKFCTCRRIFKLFCFLLFRRSTGPIP